MSYEFSGYDVPKITLDLVIDAVVKLSVTQKLLIEHIAENDEEATKLFSSIAEEEVLMREKVLNYLFEKFGETPDIS